MNAEPVYKGPWQQLVAVKHALCQDGKRRYVRITSEPDTFFSVRGSVRVKGKTVSGYVTSGEGNDGKSDYTFRAITHGKNYRVMVPEEEVK